MSATRAARFSQNFETEILFSSSAIKIKEKIRNKMQILLQKWIKPKRLGGKFLKLKSARDTYKLADDCLKHETDSSTLQ